MISEQKDICKCPRCGTSGASIAAIYLRENSLQECEGSMRLSGAGIGTGGIGLGVGSGTIDMNGETHTRRAMIFRMPERPEKESQDSELIAILGMVIVMGMGFQFMKQMVDTDSLRTLFTVLPILLMVFLTIRFFLGNDREQNAIEHRYKIALEKYKNQMQLYNSVRYCEQCNVLYENSRNICAIASPDGFEQIMRKA